MRVLAGLIAGSTLLGSNGWPEEVVLSPPAEERTVLESFPTREPQSFFDATDAGKVAPWRHGRIGDIEVLSSCPDRTTQSFVQDLWRQRALLNRALPLSMRPESRPMLLFLYEATFSGPPSPYLRHGPNVVDSFDGEVGGSRVHLVNLANFVERLALRVRGTDTGLVEAIDCPLALRGGVEAASHAGTARWWSSGRIAFSLDLVFSPEGIRCRWPPRLGHGDGAPYGENPPLPDDRRMLPLREVISGLPPYENDDAAYQLTLALFMRWAVLADGGKHLRGVERLSRHAVSTEATPDDFARHVGVELAVVERSLGTMLASEGAGFTGLLAGPERGDKPPPLRLSDATSDELRRFKKAVDDVGRRIPRM